MSINAAIDRIMRVAPVIPVLVVDDVGHARETAEALVEGGLKVLEVTLRTPDALAAIRRMNLVPGAIIGAGTVVNEAQLEEALAAGAEFIVSPGFTESLAKAAIASGDGLGQVSTSSTSFSGVVWRQTPAAIASTWSASARAGSLDW